MSGGTRGTPAPDGRTRAVRTTRVPIRSSSFPTRGVSGSVALLGPDLGLRLLGLGAALEILRALDERCDLLAAAPSDPLEVAGAVLLADGLAALASDLPEELGTVPLGGARAALLADLLVELGAVLLADELAAHAAGFGNGHPATRLLALRCHRPAPFAWRGRRGQVS